MFLQIGCISYHLELLPLYVSHRYRKHILPSRSTDRVIFLTKVLTIVIFNPHSYTLLSEICDEKGRRLAYINGWVFWVAGMAVIPFIGKQRSFTNFLLHFNI